MPEVTMIRDEEVKTMEEEARLHSPWLGPDLLPRGTAGGATHQAP